MAARRFQLKRVFFFLAAALVVGLVVWYVGFDGDGATPPDGSYRVRMARDGKKPRDQAKVKKDRRPRAKRVALSAKSLDQLQRDMKLEAEEEAKLTAKMLSIYRELQEALDKDDRKRVFALVHELQAMEEWPDGIPASVKRRALGALAWFGAPGISEAVGFLADSDPEIRKLATETFEQQFSDSWDLGDYKLADTMKAMVKVVKDTDALGSFYEQFNNMRPSVRADTAVSIYQSGNENAIKVLEANMGDIFDSSDFNYEVKDLEGVRKYLKDAQQAETDSQTKQEYDDRYGPANWGW